MSALLASDISITILSVDPTNNSVVVRPYCSLLTQPASAYQAYNFDLNSFDPTQDITQQIATRCYPIIETLYLSENVNQNSLIEFLTNNINSEITLPAISAMPQPSRLLFAGSNSAPVDAPLYHYKLSPTVSVVTTNESEYADFLGKTLSTNATEISATPATYGKTLSAIHALPRMEHVNDSNGINFVA